MADLNELFKVIAEGKKHYEETDPKGKILKETKEHAKEDLGALFASLNAIKEELEVKLVEAVAQKEEIIKEEVPLPIIKTPEEKKVETQNTVDKYLTGKSFQQPDPEVVDKNIEAIRNKIKFLEQAIGKIAATGPGGGEVNLRYLDDVARETIEDGKWLKYDGPSKKFVFDDINPYQVVYNTTHVTTPTYTIQDEDFYIGVDYAGPVTITLPTSTNSGRMLIIKDEDGDSETNPITVLGTVDNDAGGFIIQINNGAIQLIYRNGWRIV